MFGDFIKDEQQHPQLISTADEAHAELINLLKAQPNTKKTEQEIDTLSDAVWAQVHGLAILMKKGMIPTHKNRKLGIRKILEAH